MDINESGGGGGSCLAPGFRFHPTDEELVRYYLRRKIAAKPFRVDAISEIDIYKSEPWELPQLSKLKSKDLEWYFFGALDKKYSNGSKTNRATEKGYWKTTGKDRPVYHRTKIVGMKKTLVYHSGRAPKGARSNWVMHEYRLVDEELKKAGICPRDAAVLCRVFQKSGTGPKNGEQYGAPLVEDDWELDDLAMDSGEVAMGEVTFADDFYLDEDEIEQILETENPSEDVPLPNSFYYGDDNIQLEQPENLIGDPQKPLIDTSGYIIPEQFDGNKLFHLPIENDTDINTVKHEFIGESSNNSLELDDFDYLIDEPFLDASMNPPIDDVTFIEANELSNPIDDTHPSFDKVENYLNYFDTVEDSFYGDLFSSTINGSENLEMPLFEQDINDGGILQENVESKEVLQVKNSDVASTSDLKPSYYEPAKEKSFTDIKYPQYLKQSSCMLGNATEYTSKKGLSLGASHSSSPIHVTAGMIFITNVSVTDDATYWSPGKNLEIDIVISPMNEEDDCGSLLSKSAHALSRMWYNLMILIWVMILPLSFILGTCLFTRKAF